jgi:hypothetical protein
VPRAARVSGVGILTRCAVKTRDRPRAPSQEGRLTIEAPQAASFMLEDRHEVIAPGIRQAGRRDVARPGTPATCPPPGERQGLVPPTGMVGPVVGRRTQHASLARRADLYRLESRRLQSAELSADADGLRHALYFQQRISGLLRNTGAAVSGGAPTMMGATAMTGGAPLTAFSIVRFARL